MENIVRKFVTRLRKIGIEVELVGNYPWIYLFSVNGKKVTEKFYSNHAFCAFLAPATINGKWRFTDRRVVFKKIRQVLED